MNITATVSDATHIPNYNNNNNTFKKKTTFALLNFADVVTFFNNKETLTDTDIFKVVDKYPTLGQTITILTGFTRIQKVVNINDYEFVTIAGRLFEHRKSLERSASIGKNPNHNLRFEVLSSSIRWQDWPTSVVKAFSRAHFFKGELSARADATRRGEKRLEATRRKTRHSGLNEDGSVDGLNDDPKARLGGLLTTSLFLEIRLKSKFILT